MGTNGGTAAGYGDDDSDARTEMRAFDALPPDVRDMLNYATVDWSAAQLARASPGGVTQMGSVVITRPDARTPLIDKIRAEEAKFPGTPFMLRPLQRGRRR